MEVLAGPALTVGGEEEEALEASSGGTVLTVELAEQETALTAEGGTVLTAVWVAGTALT